MIEYAYFQKKGRSCASVVLLHSLPLYSRDVCAEKSLIQYSKARSELHTGNDQPHYDHCAQTHTQSSVIGLMCVPISKKMYQPVAPTLLYCNYEKSPI